MLRGLIRLIRPKHWIKNGLVAVPLLFSGQLLSGHQLRSVAGALVVFSFVASVVYVINDIRDAEKDKLHPTKRNRPVASGVVSIQAALILIFTLMVAAVTVGILIRLPIFAWVLLAVYMIINIAYSFGLKDIPIVDISILAAGFVIRVIFGGVTTGIEVSSWLYMTVIAGSLYLSLGKRRNEIRLHGTENRTVNKYYSIGFLDKNMYVSMSLLVVFYSLWATDPSRGNALLYLSIPMLILIFITYSFVIESDSSSGDPVDVLTKNKALLILVALFLILTTVTVYV